MATEAAADPTGTGETIARYVVPDHQMATGSTLGGPKICITIKATGAIEKSYSVDAGEVSFGSVVLHHWDKHSGIQLAPLPGTFAIHAEHQGHQFALSNGVDVEEKIFVLSGKPDGNRVDPPAAYYEVLLRNTHREMVELDSYAFCQLRGHLDHDVRAEYDRSRRAITVWNENSPHHVRLFGVSAEPTSFAVTDDHAIPVSERTPGLLGNKVGDLGSGDPLGILHMRSRLEPGEQARFAFVFTFSIDGRANAETTYDTCPRAEDALERTVVYYRTILDRSVVLTPDVVVNRGVLWAKANMLRMQLRPQTGWSFVNDPTRSNNSVGRDTAWFGYGADYITPEFVRESLMAYVDRQEPSGMFVEYYDIRTGKTADYGLNVNDNTPLIVLALWHHYNATGDRAMLERVYPAALKALRYMLSQRDERGLIWCTSTKTSDWGIVGWRNVITNYRLSGATTELNSECFAALATVANMARVLDRHAESAEMLQASEDLRRAINAHLLNPSNGLYYLNLDVDGRPRSDVTCDLVFPVIFGVADDATAARIISRLGGHEFWTDAGLRTVPRNAPNYGPTHGYGLLGGVWVGVAFWYAFAAARFNPGFMAHALSASFQHYSRDPRRNNTVPGQFSEWLHGETLANEGMMLSPWFPPRYLWAAIEGAGGLDLTGGSPSVSPRLAPDWKWLGVRNVPYRERQLTWFVVRTPELRLYSNCAFNQSTPYIAYDDDISEYIRATGQVTAAVALRRGADYVLFVGNALERTTTAALRLELEIAGTYRMRMFNSMRGDWSDRQTASAADIRRAIAVELERKGCCVIELAQET